MSEQCIQYIQDNRAWFKNLIYPSHSIAIDLDMFFYNMFLV